MDLGLDGKVAFITGAGHGIARMCALSFAEEGDRLELHRGNGQLQCLSWSAAHASVPVTA